MTLWERLDPLTHLNRLFLGVVAVSLVVAFLYMVWETRGLILVLCGGIWWVGDRIIKG